jgi:hypothetical protein
LFSASAAYAPAPRLDTLDTWEQYLKELRANVPDSAFKKEALIEEAERMIAKKRRGS